MRKQMRTKVREQMKHVMKRVVEEDARRGKEDFPRRDCAGCLALRRLSRFAGLTDEEFRQAFRAGVALRELGRVAILKEVS